MRDMNALRLEKAAIEALRRDMRRQLNRHIFGPTPDDRAQELAIGAAHVVFGDITSHFGAKHVSPLAGLQALVTVAS